MSSSTMRVLNSKTRTECKETVGAGLSGLNTFITAKFLTSNVNNETTYKNSTKSKNIYRNKSKVPVDGSFNSFSGSVSIPSRTCRTFLIAP